MGKFEGTITLCIKVKAKNMDEALNKLDANPVDFREPDGDIRITSEHHDLK